MPRPLRQVVPTPSAKQDRVLASINVVSRTYAEIAEVTGLMPSVVGTLLGVLKKTGLATSDEHKRWLAVAEPVIEAPSTDPVTIRVECLINARTVGMSRQDVAEILGIEPSRASWALRHLLRNARIIAKSENSGVLYFAIPKQHTDPVRPTPVPPPVPGVTSSRWGGYTGAAQPYRRAPGNYQERIGAVWDF